MTLIGIDILDVDSFHQDMSVTSEMSGHGGPCYWNLWFRSRTQPVCFTRHCGF